MLKKIRKCFSNKGQGVVEYALLLGFVAIVTVALFQDGGLTQTFRNTLSAIKSQFTTFNEAYDNADSSDDTPVVQPGGADEPAG